MSRSTRMSGAVRVLLRTVIATLSTLSFLVGQASPTAHAADGAERARPSGSGPAGPGFRLQDGRSHHARTPENRTASPATGSPRVPAPARAPALASAPMSTPALVADPARPLLGLVYADGPMSIGVRASGAGEAPRSSGGPNAPASVAMDGGHLTLSASGAGHPGLSRAGLAFTATGLLAVAWAVGGGGPRTMRRGARH
ncbi:hypothetical protein [Streptomyces sp. NPDC047985]|uniref:hypothetical protein n=1 Tax=unclassified Streptomyces TaxID=2593676 RepID=UPI003424BD85